MCLVSYLPTKDGFILSSNRDESPLRDARIIKEEKIGKEKVFYPMDTKGGSWIILSESHRVVCLLNGAFENHTMNPPYRESRGVMMKAFFEFDDAVEFMSKYDFWNIEPFTMIISERKLLYEFRWDGNVKHIKELDINRSHTWSSSTLYTAEVQIKRAQLLTSILEKTDLSNLEKIKEAHIFIDKEDLYNSLYIDRDGIVQTISHTQINNSKGNYTFHYYNLISKNTIQKSI